MATLSRVHPDVVVFGAGYTGAVVCEHAKRRGASVLGVVRSQASADKLTKLGLGIEATTAPLAEVARTRVGPNTHAIITFPATGPDELALAPLLSGARASSYLSTTGVYEDQEGVVDDSTPLPAAPSPKYRAALEAEQAFRAAGAAVLRAPGIYGRERGAHLRLLRGELKLVGDGSRYTSRIHVEDLADLLLASARAPGETFVVGDLGPCTQLELVTWLCERFGLALPGSVPAEQAHETRTRNRRVNPARALERLGVTLAYPSYRDAYPLAPEP